MGVPGRFCRWILRYLVRVWSVFSCCCSSLLKAVSSTRIPYSASALQILCTPSHTVPLREHHPYGRESCADGQRAFIFHRARNDTIKGLVESHLRPTSDAARHEF
jgi:hypothetical protein